MSFKFLGSTRVEQPKGIEVVKEGIRKLKFCEQLRKAEGGGAGTGKGSPKVELTISVDGVAVQEPKGARRVLHQYPLHRISYCADDKGEKRFFSFIAKEADSDVHMCFVFVSDKLIIQPKYFAEEITLTIGQAFELAYRRFLETSGKDLAVQQRLVALQGRTRQLEAETTELRRRLRDLAALTPQSEIPAGSKCHVPKFSVISKIAYNLQTVADGYIETSGEPAWKNLRQPNDRTSKTIKFIHII
ncbi:hypothetical protein B566_EDAN012514 [Ephemera danica]|nr:hypothetical protein B566_EDAN012514 [Ephemera danica]